MEKKLKYKVLAVDDEAGITSFLYDFFKKTKFKFLEASSARGALKLARKERPDIVLLDIKLGWGRDGLHVLKGIKAMLPETKVIMMTSSQDEDTVEKAFSLGADDYVIKPFSLKHLDKIVTLKILDLQIKALGDYAKTLQT
jgi:DNA-binding response OmpR family regulator